VENREAVGQISQRLREGVNMYLPSFFSQEKTAQLGRAKENDFASKW
jgi:hypothetical protein